jgi:hypothetical protein
MNGLVTDRQKNAAMRDGRFIIRGDKRKDEYAVQAGDSNSEASEESFDAFNIPLEEEPENENK